MSVCLCAKIYMIITYISQCFIDLEFVRIYDAHYHSDTDKKPTFKMEDGTTVYGINDLLNDVAELRANGGGDCPEYGLTGIIRTLQLFYNTSYATMKYTESHNIIVLTDAGAKEIYDVEEIRSYIKSRIKINFFFSGSNGCGSMYPIYRNIADLVPEGGLVVEQINQEGLQQFINFITANTDNRKKRASTNCESFDISNLVASFQVLIETTQPSVMVVDPSNATTTISTVGNSFAVYSNTSPQYGSWTACVSSGTLSITLQLSFNLDFKIQYVMQTDMGDLLPIIPNLFSCKLHHVHVDLMYNNNMYRLPVVQSLVKVQSHSHF